MLKNSPCLLLLHQEKGEDDEGDSFKPIGTILGEHSRVSHHLNAPVYLMAWQLVGLVHTIEFS